MGKKNMIYQNGTNQSTDRHILGTYFGESQPRKEDRRSSRKTKENLRGKEYVI
jgi:hypothetical protein